MNYTDIIIFLIIIIIVVAIVMVNISSVIDKKLSNVEVNIPPINIPPPQVTVKLQKSCTSDEYSVFIDKNVQGQPTQTISLSPITQSNSTNTSDDKTEHFGPLPSQANEIQASIQNAINNASSNMNELSTTVSNAVKNTTEKIQNDIKNAKIESEALLPKISVANQGEKIKVYPKYASTDQTSELNIQYPNDDEIVQYGDYKCYKKAPPKIDTVQISEKCGNKSLNDAQKNAYGYMASNMKGIAEVSFPSCGKYEKDLIGENLDQINDVDITQLYREEQTFVKAYLEDPVVRGYNLDSYGQYSPLFTSGKISTNKDVNNPKPSGYIFPNSVAFDR